MFCLLKGGSKIQEEQKLRRLFTTWLSKVALLECFTSDKASAAFKERALNRCAVLVFELLCFGKVKFDGAYGTKKDPSTGIIVVSS